MKPVYSIVVPVYRSAPWLDELVERITAAMDGSGRPDWELILVNDGSPDDVTWPAVAALAARHARVRGIDLLFNTGQFRALLCGMEHSRADLVITMDDDLQHPPEELPVLIEALAEKPDALCVMGAYAERRDNVLRRAGRRLFDRILDRAYGKPPGIRTTSFRIMRRPLVEAVLAYRTAKPQLGPLIVSLTRRVATVPVRHAPRPHGRSNYNLPALLRGTVDSVVHASTAPLRLLSSFGFFCAAASFVTAVVYLARWATGGIGVPGYTSQILLIIFFGGMTLLGIGVLGEYVARIIGELTGPEKYTVAHRAGFGGDGDA